MAEGDSAGGMIRGEFLSGNDRRALIEIARDGLAEHRVARRANGLVRQNRDRCITVRDWRDKSEIPSEDQAMTVRHSASAAEHLCL